MALLLEFKNIVIAHLVPQSKTLKILRVTL